MPLALSEEGAEIVLSISGPPEADPGLDAFWDAFVPGQSG
jgi:hypothetical protein